MLIFFDTTFGAKRNGKTLNQKSANFKARCLGFFIKLFGFHWFIHFSFAFTSLCLHHGLCSAAEPELEHSSVTNQANFGSAENNNKDSAATAAPNDAQWWLARHQMILEKLKTRSPALFFIGDSITQDWEKNAPLPWGNFVDVWKRYYGARNAMNLGFGGDTTANVLWRIQNGEVDNSSPKVTVLLIGANNSELKGWHAEETQGAIVKIVDVLHSKLPNTKILLLGILPSDRSEWITKTNLKVNEFLAARFGHNKFVTYLDVRYAFLKNGLLDKTLFYEPQKQMPGRSLHPNAAGQERLAEAIEPQLRRMLKAKNRKWKSLFFKVWMKH